jgi:hypothetical protein
MEAKFKNYLKGDPLPWLLGAENPSVRFWTLSDIMGLPPDDQYVVEARLDIARLPLVVDLFASQKSDGHWGDDPAKPYTAAGTLGVLIVLYSLGVAPDERTAAGCGTFLRFCQSKEGGFSMVKTRPSGISPCTTGEHLPMLLYFGMGNDPRVQSAFMFLIEDMSSENPLDCGRYQHQDCLWGAIAALNGMAVLPGEWQTPQSEAVVGRLSDALLDAEYDFEGEHKRWLTFGVPRGWDLLSALRALAMHGRANDPRFTALFELFLKQQDENGRFLCSSSSRTWPLEKRNRPSKWVTLDAVRLLKTIEEQSRSGNI